MAPSTARTAHLPPVRVKRLERDVVVRAAQEAGLSLSEFLRITATAAARAILARRRRPAPGIPL